MRPLDRFAGLGDDVVELPAQAGGLVLELHDRLHAGQVEAGLGQLVDAPQPVDVALAVAPAASAGAGRVEQAAAFVDAQGLRVDPGQLGGHRDDVHTAFGATR